MATEQQRGLGGRVPLEIAATEAGARQAEELIGRLAHGIHTSRFEPQLFFPMP